MKDAHCAQVAGASYALMPRILRKCFIEILLRMRTERGLAEDAIPFDGNRSMSRCKRMFAWEFQLEKFK